jgi:hypothetical protein
MVFTISNITTQSTGSHFLIQITLFFIKKKNKKTRKTSGKEETAKAEEHDKIFK